MSQEIMKLSEVIKVRAKYANRLYSFYVLYKNQEVKSKFKKLLAKHDVEYCQRIGKIWKQKEHTVGSARYGMWHDIMKNDKKL